MAQNDFSREPANGPSGFPFFEHHHTVMLIIEPDTGAIIDANAAAIKFYGYRRDVLLSMSIADINQLPPEEVRAQRRRADNEEQTSFVFSHRLASGAIRVVEVDSSPTVWQGRRVLFSLIHDISERIQAEEALHESNDRYRSLVESSPDGVILYKNGIFLYANSAALSMYGAESFEMLQSKMVLDLIHEDDRDAISARMQAVETGEVLPLQETRIRRIDGSILHVESAGSRVNYRGGYANQIIIRDITERKKKEEELFRLNRTYKALSSGSQAMMRATDELQFMQDVCTIIREECCYSLVWIGLAQNDEYKSVRPVMYSGFDSGYLETLNISWGDNERGLGPTGTAIRTGEYRTCANMLTDPSFAPWRGEAVKRGYASSIAFPLKNQQGTFGALTIYAREPEGFAPSEIRLLNEMAADLAYGITALRLRAEHAKMEEEIRRSRDLLEHRVVERTRELARSEERFRTTLENLPEGCMIIDCGWMYLYVNDAIARRMGRRKRDIVAHTVMELEPEIESTPVFECYRSCMEERINREFIHDVALADGSTRTIELHCVPIPEGIFVLSADITERIRTERALRQYNEQLQSLSQRLIEAQEAERRRIAFELHDEIGQVLTAIQLNLRGIVDFEDAKDIPERLEETIGFTDRLLQQVREMSVDLRPWMLDQLGLVASVRWYVDKQAQRGKFTMEFDARNITGRLPTLIEITSYRVIQETVTNIVRHAQATNVRVALALIDGALVAEISDNGIGFSMDELKDRPISGRGLGTLGMKERITSLGGTIEISSAPGRGTTVKFELPLSRAVHFSLS
ncbi:MAG: PAS domain S-box protein [Acidobacteriota bacterium]